MVVVQTSIVAYQELKESTMLNRLQTTVYEALKSMGRPVTDRELIEYAYLSEDIKPRSRRNELVKKGAVKGCGKRSCEVTRKLAYTWEVI